MTSPRASAWLSLVAAALLIGGAVTLQAVKDGRFAQIGSETDFLYVRSGKALDRLALSFDDIIADVYWIRAIQYFGRTRLSEEPGKTYENLYPLLDLTTTLDPRFNIAYRFGAIFLSEGYPDGPSEPRRAIALLEKGFAANPHRWEYLHDIGFVHYWWLRDYEQAAHWFQRASQVEGAPAWLTSVAAVTLARGGDRASSRMLWRRLLDTAEHDYLRRAAEHRLVQLAVMDQLDQLAAVIDRYRLRFGAAPSTWHPLVEQGWLRGVPTDPDGMPYVIDSATGRPTVDQASRYYPLPSEQSAPPAGPALGEPRP